MRRWINGLIVGLLGIAAVPATAPAAETLGAAGFAGSCGDDKTWISPSVANGPDYFANAPGVVTSWRTNSDSDPNGTLRFEVLKPNPGGGANHLIAVQKDGVRTLQPDTLNVFMGLHLPIAAGDTVGVYVPAGQAGGNGSCLSAGPAADKRQEFVGDPPLGVSTAFSAPTDGARLNLAAIVEPDADKDNFGDETQDACPTDAAVQTTCPVPATPVTKKKCKRKRKGKKRSAATAKRKKKKGCRKKKKSKK